MRRKGNSNRRREEKGKRRRGRKREGEQEKAEERRGRRTLCNNKKGEAGSGYWCHSGSRPRSELVILLESLNMILNSAGDTSLERYSITINDSEINR